MALTLVDRGRALLGRDRAQTIDFRRMIKFGTVGVSGTCIDEGIFLLLTTAFGVFYLLASAVSAEVAICSNYLLNNNWTFADRRTGFISASGLGRYHLVSFGGIGIKLAIAWLLVSHLAINPKLANLGGISLAMIWNYILNICWTWRRQRVPVAEPAVYARG